MSDEDQTQGISAIEADHKERIDRVLAAARAYSDACRRASEAGRKLRELKSEVNRMDGDQDLLAEERLEALTELTSAARRIP
jgi:hypothetical protein